MGTIQSTYTDFRYVRSIWKRNAEEERLLGVSLTGIYDCPLLNGRASGEGRESGSKLDVTLQELKDYCVEVNKEFATKLGINPSVAITTVKPSGTVSQLVNSASGIHPRHSQWYIRSVRQDNKDPLTHFLKDAGIPWEPCVMKPDSTTVFFFPVASPEGAVTRDKVDAVSHLELWKEYNSSWAEHQVSITVSVREEEWPRVGAWVYDNFDELSGVSFLPMDGGTYRQSPYMECTEQEYLAAVEKMPSVIDWSILQMYEKIDSTTSSHELACTSGACEIL